MQYFFSLAPDRKISQANYMHYPTPSPHPTRVMREHDFIFLQDGEWIIGQEDETFCMKKNDVLILSAHQRHYGEIPCLPHTRTMFFHISCLPEDHPVSEEPPSPSNGLTLPNFLHVSSAPNIKTLFEKIIRANAEHNSIVAAAYFNVLLYELHEVSFSLQEGTLAQKIQELILSTPDRILTNFEIAEHFQISKKTAETAFARRYQTTIHQYILQLKIEQAQHLLLNFPGQRLHTVAQSLGFYDEFHLSRQFKAVCGCSPKEYRKTNEKPDV